MCEPATIGLASLALSSAGTAASFVGQSQAARAQNKAAEASAREANRSYVNQLSQAQNQSRQERAAAIQRLQASRRDARAAQATANVAAATAGVSGNSVSALQSDLGRQGGEAAAAIQRNTDAAALAGADTRQSIFAQARSRTNAARSSTTSGPNPFAAALQLGQGALNASTVFTQQTIADRQADV